MAKALGEGAVGKHKSSPFLSGVRVGALHCGLTADENTVTDRFRLIGRQRGDVDERQFLVAAAAMTAAGSGNDPPDTTGPVDSAPGPLDAPQRSARRGQRQRGG